MREIVMALRAISLLGLSALPLLSTAQGIMSLSYPLHLADEVFVATITSSVEETSDGSVDLLVQRSLRGSAKAGSTIVATYTIINSGMIGAPKRQINSFRGITGVWFLKHSELGWILISRISNATSLYDIYLPVPAEEPTARYAYSASTDVRKKLLLEIEAAAVNPKTLKSIAEVWARLIIDDLGPSY